MAVSQLLYPCKLLQGGALCPLFACGKGKRHGIGSHKRVQAWSLPITSCMTSGKLPNPYESQVLNLPNGEDNNPSLPGKLWWATGLCFPHLLTSNSTFPTGPTPPPPHSSKLCVLPKEPLFSNLKWCKTMCVLMIFCTYHAANVTLESCSNQGGFHVQQMYA